MPFSEVFDLPRLRKDLSGYVLYILIRQSSVRITIRANDMLFTGWGRVLWNGVMSRRKEAQLSMSWAAGVSVLVLTRKERGPT